MAPKRKNNSEKGSSKTTKQRRISKRVIGTMELHNKNKSVVVTQKQQQSQSKGKQNKNYAADDSTESQLDIIGEEDISKENPKSMSIDSNDINSRDQEFSTSDSCFPDASNTDARGEASSAGRFHIDDDDDDTDEFKAMFMSNAVTSKPRPSYSSTPLVQSQHNGQPAMCATDESLLSKQMKSNTRSPLSTNTVDHPSTMSNTYARSINTPINPRVNTISLPLSQVSTGNQSLSSINYTKNNSAILETFVEYRTLKRELQNAVNLSETWKADNQVLLRRIQKLENSSFPRPNADGRAFLEQLLESLTTSEHDGDSRSSNELANDIGLPETTLLSFSSGEPQKTALRTFNALFPTNHDKQSLFNIANLNVGHPTLLENILLFARRCAPGSGYSMGMLKEAIGNSIRCARHKIKMENSRIIAATAMNQAELNRGNGMI